MNLLPGKYRLTKDIVNPKPDRRTRIDWRKFDKFRAGAIFYAREIEMDIERRTIKILQLESGPYPAAHSVSEKNPIFALLAQHLERVGDQDHVMSDDEKLEILTSALREVVDQNELIAAADFALTTPGMIKGRIELEQAVAKARKSGDIAKRALAKLREDEA